MTFVRRSFTLLLVALVGWLSVAPLLHARQPTLYGAPITLDAATKVLDAAQAEAAKNNWPVAISVVDGSDFLVAFRRIDNTRLGSIEVSLEKAKAAALFRRPTKVFEESIEKGSAGLRVLKLPGGLPIEGGLPIVVDGKVVGAVGVSGVTSQQDGEVAKAGAGALQ